MNIGCDIKTAQRPQLISFVKKAPSSFPLLGVPLLYRLLFSLFDHCFSLLVPVLKSSIFSSTVTILISSAVSSDLRSTLRPPSLLGPSINRLFFGQGARFRRFFIKRIREPSAFRDYNPFGGSRGNALSFSFSQLHLCRPRLCPTGGVSK